MSMAMLGVMTTHRDAFRSSSEVRIRRAWISADSLPDLHQSISVSELLHSDSLAGVAKREATKRGFT